MCYECTLLVEIAIHPWPSVYYKTIIHYTVAILRVLVLSAGVDWGSLVAGFSIISCRPFGDRWQLCELWSAFVGCWELFRLAPIQCADWTGAITQIVYLIFYPLLRQLQKRLSTLSSAECLSSFFPDKQGGPGSSCSCRSNPIWSHSVYFFI